VNVAKREYPQAPIAAVGVIVHHDERIVLIQRAKDPFAGYWTFPGGAVDLGEPVREAARREALEETGLAVELEGIAAVIDNVVRDPSGQVRYHYVIADYLAHPISGSLRPGTDAQDARWVSAADLDNLKVTPHAERLARQVLTGDGLDLARC
jgi:ADP-ribose pyrophosphatase YjhB (NUDIX family)